MDRYLVLPIAHYQFDLSAVEFHDALALRYHRPGPSYNYYFMIMMATTNFYKRIASMLAEKKKSSFSMPISLIRCCLSFALLRSSIMCMCIVTRIVSLLTSFRFSYRPSDNWKSFVRVTGLVFILFKFVFEELYIYIEHFI